MHIVNNIPIYHVHTNHPTYSMHETSTCTSDVTSMCMKVNVLLDMQAVAMEINVSETGKKYLCQCLLASV